MMLRMLFGEIYKSRGIASYGNASCFSFHATKVFNTIVDGVGANAKMNEFCAAMDLCNLRYVEGEIEKRKRVVERYRSHLEEIDGIRLNPV